MSTRYVTILMLVCVAVTIGATVFILATDPPTTQADIVIPPGATDAERNATFATIRTNCLAACSPDTFVNFGLKDTAGTIGTIQGSSYPSCICRDKKGTLKEIVLHVARP